jgi:hypothetical protein
MVVLIYLLLYRPCDARFAHEANTLAFVRLRLAQAAQLGGHLADELLVRRFQADDRVLSFLLSRAHLDLRGQVDGDGVREAQCQLELLTLRGGAVTHTDQFLLDDEAFAHTLHHVGDE